MEVDFELVEEVDNEEEIQEEVESFFFSFDYVILLKEKVFRF